MKHLFKDLSLEEILALAVQIESNNAERLQTIADLYSDYDKSIQKYFEAIKLEELNHKRFIEDLWVKKLGDKPIPIVSEDIVNDVIEAFDVDSGEHFIFDDVTLENAHGMVEKAEREAYLFYLKAAAVVEDMEVKNLLSELAAIEYGHMVNIPGKIKSEK